MIPHDLDARQDLLASVMTPKPTAEALKALITQFLLERMALKLTGLSEDDPSRAEITLQFQPERWIARAAQRVVQIQKVTHALKATHPEAKGTSWFAPPAEMTPLPVVGSHCLRETAAMDVVGNAAALDVYKFLQLSCEGHTLLALAQTGDAALAAAFSEDAQEAQAWMAAFATLTKPKGPLSSHTLAKQLYWLVSDDVHDATSFHLLGPLHASALTHQVYALIHAAYFDTSAREARDARKANALHPETVHTYRNLAIQQMGGSHPQNISYLNATRVLGKQTGVNYLLSSVPPQWMAKTVAPLWHVSSLFTGFKSRETVQLLLSTWRAREARASDAWMGCIEALLDELLVFVAELRELAPGWSLDAKCLLSPLQAQWLDPYQHAQLPLDNAKVVSFSEVLIQISQDWTDWLVQQWRASGMHGLDVDVAQQKTWQQMALRSLIEFDDCEDMMLTCAVESVDD